MKNIVLLFVVMVTLLSCNSREFQDQRCYGLLIDSLTKLSKFRDRVASLEKGAKVMAKEHQSKIESLQKTLDSFTAGYKKTKVVYMTKRYKKSHKATTAKCHYKMDYYKKGDKTNSIAPFYYDYYKQKYFFYDNEVRAYYSLDPITGEKRYI